MPGPATAPPDPTHDKRARRLAAEEALLVALLLGATLREAAELTGLSLRTVGRHYRSARFQALLADARSRVVSAVADRAADALSGALSVLIQLCHDPAVAAQTRVLAAKAIIDSAVRTRELVSMTVKSSEEEAKRSEQTPGL